MVSIIEDKLIDTLKPELAFFQCLCILQYHKLNLEQQVNENENCL